MGKLFKILDPKLLFILFINSILGGILVTILFLTLPFFKKNDINTPDLDIIKKITKIEVEEVKSSIPSIAKEISNSIVGIKSTNKSDYLFFPKDNIVEGSGIVIRKDGYIITNSHVIENSLKDGTIEVFFKNNSSYPQEAVLIGKNENKDIAVIKIESSDLITANLGNSNELKVGETVIAIGNPNGLEYFGSVTVGVISGLNRIVSISDKNLSDLIQTDVSIAPGNSGGALLNLKGEVIGVNTSKITNEDYEGIAFSIPINEADKISKELIKNKK
ncbi:MAG: trypsin-like peptidase domain-containing protein [Clostridiales bacterium]